MVVKLINECKVCTKCKLNKHKSEYNKCNKIPCGLDAQCKSCKNEREKQRRVENPEYNKNYRKENKEKLKQKRFENKDVLNEKTRIWRKNNPEKNKASYENYAKNNPEKVKQKCINYVKNNQEKVKSTRKAYREKNLEKCLERCRDYKSKNRKRVNETNRVWLNKRRKENPKYRILESASAGIRRGIKKNGKTWTTFVDYSRENLIKHLESKFTKGMTWENYGINGWHIDHIIPQVYFNFDSPDHPAFKACWALSNLQPLWGTTKIAISYGESSDYVGNSDKQHKIEMTPEIQKFLNEVNGECNGEG